MPIKLTIEALQTIDAISRKGSFSAAASELNKVPSALTYHMNKLERDLNVSLFNRDGYRTTLTEAGEALLIEAKLIIEKVQDAEAHVKRIATGIESNITIAVTDLFQIEALFNTMQEFYAQNFGTHIKFTREVYGGSWDALASNRADIALGAPGEPPAESNFATKHLGNMEAVFAIAPAHPLAQIKGALSSQDIMPFRIAVVADSSQNLPPRATSGILTGQEVLTVPDMQTKISMQLAGLAVGYLPKALAQNYEQQGKLVLRKVGKQKTIIPLQLAWRKQRQKTGPAQAWLLKKFSLLSIDKLLLK